MTATTCWIAIKVQFKTGVRFNVVEKSIWNKEGGIGGQWLTGTPDLYTLYKPTNGESGTLLFANNDERFLVVVGVTNNTPWCHIRKDLGKTETGVASNALYYRSNTPEYNRRWLSDASGKEFSVVNSHNRVIAIKYTVTSGERLSADLIVA